MLCKVLQSFAGVQFSAAKGTTINLPLGEAKSLEYAGIVEILEDFVPEVAYETAVEAKQAMETKVVKPKKKRGV